MIHYSDKTCQPKQSPPDRRPETIGGEHLPVLFIGYREKQIYQKERQPRKATPSRKLI